MRLACATEVARAMARFSASRASSSRFDSFVALAPRPIPGAKRRSRTRIELNSTATKMQPSLQGLDHNSLERSTVCKTFSPLPPIAGRAAQSADRIRLSLRPCCITAKIWRLPRLRLPKRARYIPNVSFTTRDSPLQGRRTYPGNGQRMAKATNI
jgi:hypothetical protein